MAARLKRMPVLLIHGGAGSRRPTKTQLTCLSDTLRQGSTLLQEGKSAFLAVEHTIALLEASGLFNAGAGSHRQLDGIQRMDAAIMEGKALAAGAVAGLEGILHPITVARLVMTNTDHVMVYGKHARRIARHFSVPRLPRIKTMTRPLDKGKGGVDSLSLTLFKKMGSDHTVGAVALDHQGTLAAGASTGGVPLMFPGRVGDTPLIGAGVYADNSAAGISMTGIGEAIIRMGMAKWLATMVQQGYTPQRSGSTALRALVRRVRGEAGCLVLTPKGNFAIQHTTPWMGGGFWNGRGQPVVQDHFDRIRSSCNT